MYLANCKPLDDKLCIRSHNVILFNIFQLPIYVIFVISISIVIGLRDLTSLLVSLDNSMKGFLLKKAVGLSNLRHDNSSCHYD